MPTKEKYVPKNGTYRVKVECSNCEHDFEVEFPKGEKTHGKHECPNCGCETDVRAPAKPPAMMPIPYIVPQSVPQPYPVPYPVPQPYPVPVNPYPSPWFRWNQPTWISNGTRWYTQYGLGGIQGGGLVGLHGACSGVGSLGMNGSSTLRLTG